MPEEKTFPVTMLPGFRRKRLTVRGGDVVTVEAGDTVDVTPRDWGSYFRYHATRTDEVRQAPTRSKDLNLSALEDYLKTHPATPDFFDGDDRAGAEKLKNEYGETLRQLNTDEPTEETNG